MFTPRNFAGSAARVAAPQGLVLPRRRQFLKDNFATYDQATYDSAGAFLIGELERLDPMIHEPLIATTWTRDIDLRTDVTMGDTVSSYTVSTFGATGGNIPSGIAWAGNETTAIPRATLDIGKIANPLNLWSMEVAYTLPELVQAQQTGRPIDTQMLDALNRKHQMDADQIVYIGDSSINTTGLFNNSLVTNVSNVAATGTGSSTLWVNKSADQIRADFNEVLISAWAASGYTSPPSKVALSPSAFGYITTTIVSSAGNQTIYSFLKENNILTAEKGIPLDIVSVKWLAAANRAGASSDRMVAYTQKKEFVRFPMVPIVPTSTQYRGIWVNVPYYGKMGVVEVVYPETIAYRDGIA